jgi:hypothetical protein
MGVPIAGAVAAGEVTMPRQAAPDELIAAIVLMPVVVVTVRIAIAPVRMMTAIFGVTVRRRIVAAGEMTDPIRVSVAMRRRPVVATVTPVPVAVIRMIAEAELITVIRSTIPRRIISAVPVIV